MKPKKRRYGVRRGRIRSQTHNWMRHESDITGIIMSLDTDQYGTKKADKAAKKFLNNLHFLLAAAVRRQWRARRVVGVCTAAVATP